MALEAKSHDMLNPVNNMLSNIRKLVIMSHCFGPDQITMTHWQYNERINRYSIISLKIIKINAKAVI